MKERRQEEDNGRLLRCRLPSAYKSAPRRQGQEAALTKLLLIHQHRQREGGGTGGGRDHLVTGSREMNKEECYISLLLDLSGAAVQHQDRGILNANLPGRVGHQVLGF